MGFSSVYGQRNVFYIEEAYEKSPQSFLYSRPNLQLAASTGGGAHPKDERSHGRSKVRQEPKNRRHRLLLSVIPRIRRKDDSGDVLTKKRCFRTRGSPIFVNIPNYC